MALFVFGAGATRGCSFVDPARFPCLPPLDRDFFTHLQRVSNSKHQGLVTAVMQDVVDLFGSNFDVTMETVFTTLEHTLRLLRATGERKEFRAGELEQKQSRLKQAIAAVLEESLTEKGRKSRECEHHKKFVQSLLSGDCILSFNYDCVLDYALKVFGDEKWNARHGYGFPLGPKGSRLHGDRFWSPSKPATKADTVRLLKLHGSLHFKIAGTGKDPDIELKERPYTKQAGSALRFSIIPPEWNKQFDSGIYGRLWSKAAVAINRAEHIVFVGYSLPPTDLHSTALFRTSVKRGSLKSLTVVNPDRDARRRIRAVLQRGLNGRTRVLSFDRFKEFVATDRGIWSV